VGAFMNELLHIDRPCVTGWRPSGVARAKTLRQRSLCLDRQSGLRSFDADRQWWRSPL